MSSDYKKTQNIFPHPKRDDLKKLTAKGCICIADQVKTKQHPMMTLATTLGKL